MQASWKLSSVAELLESLQVDARTQAAIAALPQRSKGWKEERYGRLTSSNFAAASGQQGQSKKKALLVAMVWPEFAGLTGYALKMAQHGVDNEDNGRNVYVADRLSNGSGLFHDPRICIRETGLLVSLTDGWLACSPDFVMQEPANCRAKSAAAPSNPHHVFEPYRIPLPAGVDAYLDGHDRLLRDVPSEATDTTHTEWVTVAGEIKCPAYGDKELYSINPKHAEFGFPKLYIPQIQGVMNLMNWPFSDTVVFTPAVVEVTRFRKDEAYWNGTLFPALRKFYFDEFLPFLELRCKGKLEPGSIVPVSASVPRSLDAAASSSGLLASRHARIQDPLAIMLGSSEDEVPLLVHASETQDHNLSKRPPVQSSVPCALPQWLLTGKLPTKK